MGWLLLWKPASVSPVWECGLVQIPTVFPLVGISAENWKNSTPQQSSIVTKTHGLDITFAQHFWLYWNQIFPCLPTFLAGEPLQRKQSARLGEVREWWCLITEAALWRAVTCSIFLARENWMPSSNRVSAADGNHHSQAFPMIDKLQWMPSPAVSGRWALKQCWWGIRCIKWEKTFVQGTRIAKSSIFDSLLSCS